MVRAAGFTLSLYPWTYNAQYDGTVWQERYVDKSVPGAEAEDNEGQQAQPVSGMVPATVPKSERTNGVSTLGRNSFPELPLVNYTSQYGLGCFEGMKAFPQRDGSLKLFRPDLNALRFRESMEGIQMPGFPTNLFLQAVREVARRNKALGCTPTYDTAWEKDNFQRADSVYIRPFSWAEGGIGVNLSSRPFVIIIATSVGSYFDPDASSKAVTTDMVRATNKGTGWIKCAANYVIPTLAKKQAIDQGYMEVIFLDYKEERYLEEGSSCNIFCLLKNGVLVTPALEKRILDGITRRSTMHLARALGLKVEERRISIEEAMSETQECFVTGTAAGITFIESITHKGTSAVFNQGRMGELTQSLMHKLKGIQYGALEDTYDWMVAIE